ncbi:MAG: FAD-binding protein [Gemmatimonadales bacterium]|nr:FAD-binding protein [Gemmatimonadales bacterium]
MGTQKGPALAGLSRILGPDALLTDPAARLVYSRDSSHMTLGRPLGIALPADASTLRKVVRFCKVNELAVVTRGTGTGLSGGAVPNEGEVVLATSQLKALGPVDDQGLRVRAEAGVLNDQVSAHASSFALHFAPDPSSQSISSIGGNIAENAGGPHCLRHGVTLHHLLRLEWCDVQGRALTTGRGLACERGIDLTSLLCGSEGTLGVVTAADLKLVTDPQSVATMAAFFPDLNDATGSVVSLLRAGLMPVAVEMVDQPMLEAVEAAFGFGFPTDVAAAMILEFAGQPEEVAEDADQAGNLLMGNGAREIRRAEDAATRMELWKCRKKAFGAVGRLAPSYVTMDVVVPLGKLPDLVREIQVIKAKHGVEIATAFHAGDGNLHPGVHYDDRDSELRRAAHEAADEIIRTALAMDGSVTGEHGVGIEKLHAVPWQLDPVSLELMWDIKRVFDPEDRLNPGKALPPPGSALAVPPSVPRGCTFNWDSMTVTAEADVSLSELQAQALERGLWLPVGLAAATTQADDPMGPGLGSDRSISSVVENILFSPALVAGGSARHFLLELWAETGAGRLLHTGAPVFKNVAGYNLAQMLCGSGRVLAQPRAATFQLRPAPEKLGVWRFADLSGDGNFWEGIHSLIDRLAHRDPTLGGPVFVIDGSQEDCSASGPQGTVTVLAPGRDRSWDLGDLDKRLVEVASLAGLELLEQKRFDFRSWSHALVHLPDWALAWPDWSVSAKRIQGKIEADRGPGDLQKTSFLPQKPPSRMIWQASPALVWIPGSATENEGWCCDHCCSGGKPTQLPDPDAGVPLDLLRGMKKVFDPDGRLDNPLWLKDENHG